MDALEKFTGVAEMKEQIIYTVFYFGAAVVLLIMDVPGFVSLLLIIGAVLYNVWKIGKAKYWFEEDSSTNTAIAISYLVVVGAGVISALLYTLHIL